MKKNIIILVFLCNCVYAFTQTLHGIPCPNNVENSVVSTIDDYLSKNNYDRANFKIIQVLKLQPDTCDSIHYYIDNKQLYLLEIKNNGQADKMKKEINLYSWNSQYKKMTLVSKDKYSNRLLLSFVNLFNSDCIYFIRAFHNSEFDCLYIRTNDKLGGQEYLSTNILNYFSSLKEYLEYSFGSVENYIETYHKRQSFILKQNRPIRDLNWSKQKN